MTALTQTLTASLYGGAHMSAARNQRVTAAAGDTLAVVVLHGLGACPFSHTVQLRTVTAPAVSLMPAPAIALLSWDATIATFAVAVPAANQTVDVQADFTFNRPHSVGA